MELIIGNQSLPKNYNNDSASAVNKGVNAKPNNINMEPGENPAYMINLSPEAQKMIRDSAKQNDIVQNTYMTDFIESINKRASLIDKESALSNEAYTAKKKSDIVV